MIPGNIKEEHVKKALMEIDKQGVPKGRASRKFILEFDGKKYPPKYVLSLANKYANGIFLDSEVFGGGNETNQFLKSLGFQIFEKNQTEAEEHKSIKISKNRVKKHNERCKVCKERVHEMIQEIFGEVKRDYDLDLPSKLESFENISEFKALNNIYKSLEGYRGFKDFVKANKLANVDFLFLILD